MDYWEILKYKYSAWDIQIAFFPQSLLLIEIFSTKTKMYPNSIFDLYQSKGTFFMEPSISFRFQNIFPFNGAVKNHKPCQVSRIWIQSLISFRLFQKSDLMSIPKVSKFSLFRNSTHSENSFTSPKQANIGTPTVFDRSELQANLDGCQHVKTGGPGGRTMGHQWLSQMNVQVRNKAKPLGQYERCWQLLSRPERTLQELRKECRYSRNYLSLGTAAAPIRN